MKIPRASLLYQVITPFPTLFLTPKIMHNLTGNLSAGSSSKKMSLAINLLSKMVLDRTLGIYLMAACLLSWLNKKKRSVF
jgi:hypothetical protein